VTQETGSTGYAQLRRLHGEQTQEAGTVTRRRSPRSVEAHQGTFAPRGRGLRSPRTGNIGGDRHAAMMAAAPGAAAAAAARRRPAVEEKTSFNVVLRPSRATRSRSFKAVRGVTTLGLKEPSARREPAADGPREASQGRSRKIKAQLVEAGGEVEFNKNASPWTVDSVVATGCAWTVRRRGRYLPRAAPMAGVRPAAGVGAHPGMPPSESPNEVFEGSRVFSSRRRRREESEVEVQ